LGVYLSKNAGSDEFENMKEHEPRPKPCDATAANDNTGSGIAVSSITDVKLKKPYKPPQVIEYGNVVRLTAGSNGSRMDPGHNTPTKLGNG
jgi:hypothetical protein